MEPATVEAGIENVRRSPADAGTVELIVRRPSEESREVVSEAELDAVGGLVGDNWSTRGSKHTEDGSADPECQLTLTNARAIAFVAESPERWQLAGDQFYVDFDLSEANVPPGTRLAIGDAVIEISETPHRGCGKFSRRFGVDALKLVNSDVGRELNLRGVNAKIVSGGTVRTGDSITKLSRFAR